MVCPMGPVRIHTAFATLARLVGECGWSGRRRRVCLDSSDCWPLGSETGSNGFWRCHSDGNDRQRYRMAARFGGVHAGTDTGHFRSDH